MAVHAYLRYALGGGLVVVRHKASQAIVRFCRPMLRSHASAWRLSVRQSVLVVAVSSELVRASFACALAPSLRGAVRSHFSPGISLLVGLLLLVPYRRYEILIARFTRCSMGGLVRGASGRHHLFVCLSSRSPSVYSVQFCRRPSRASPRWTVVGFGFGRLVRLR